MAADSDGGPATSADAAADADVAAADVPIGPPLSDSQNGPDAVGPAKGPPTLCGCPQAAGTNRPPECLPCAAAPTEGGSCLPPQQTAPMCAPPPAVCKCATAGAKAPPAACGCPTSFDWWDNLAQLAGVSKDKLSAADVAKKAKPLDVAKNKAALAGVLQSIAKGQLPLADNPLLGARLAAAISSLANAAPYSVNYANNTVSGGKCTATGGGLSCGGAPIFTSFIHNFHDFVNFEPSFSLLLDLVSYHTDSAILVPLNVYIDTQLLDVWVEHYGEANMMALLSANPSLLVVSYHVRAPMPYADDTYWRDWKNSADTQAATLVTAYETFRMDRSDGELPFAANFLGKYGGYSYLKSLAGYAPPVVTGADANSTTDTHVQALKQAMATYYATDGAKLTVSHAGGASGVTDLCEKDSTGKLHLRPESMSVTAYEQTTDKSAIPAILFAGLIKDFNAPWPSTGAVTGVNLFDELASPLLAAVQQTDSKRIFLNFKWHDDNFYMNLTPWLRIYANDASAHSLLGAPHPAECNKKVDCSPDVAIEDWNGDLVVDTSDVCPVVKDDTACGLTANNLYWDLSRGVDVTSYDAYCPDGDGGKVCPTKALDKKTQAECMRKCQYVKPDEEKQALVANYKALLAYVKSNPRFRIVSGSDEAAMAADVAICPP